MSKFYEVSSDAVDRFSEIFNKKSFPLAIKFQFIGSESQKTLIKISKLPDQYVFLLEKELLVTINEDLMSVFDDESITILIEQEIDKVSIDIQSGKIKMVKPNLNTFSSLITKYGIDKVTKANSVENLYQDQKNDGKEEFIA
jgi:hypothetical protein